MAEEIKKDEETTIDEQETVNKEETEEIVEESQSGEEETVKDEDTAEEKKGDKKLFGKKKDKNLEKLQEKLAESEDKRMRQLAEFENFRKRSEKEKSQMFEIGAKSVIEKILPVIDNFERGLGGIAEEDKDTPLVQGFELVYKQLMTAFEELGVTPIQAVGEPFDPNLHNAVMMVDDEEKESDTVAEEMQKGYMYKESVVRHSMVKVVN